jgi:hypothetical protein
MLTIRIIFLLNIPTSACHRIIVKSGILFILFAKSSNWSSRGFIKDILLKRRLPTACTRGKTSIVINFIYQQIICPSDDIRIISSIDTLINIVTLLLSHVVVDSLFHGFDEPIELVLFKNTWLICPLYVTFNANIVLICQEFLIHLGKLLLLRHILEQSHIIHFL